MATKVQRINVNGIECELDITSAGTVSSQSGNEYRIKADNEGNLYTFTGSTDPYEPSAEPKNAPSGTDIITSLTGTPTYKLYINSFYCGGDDADVHTLNYCSHNFIELANLSAEDINLSGISIQYAKTSTDWRVLPLTGVIRKGSTFLIRGGACSVYDFAKVKVDRCDIDWLVDESGDYSKNGTGIKFSSDTAKFYLCFTTKKCTYVNPFSPGGVSGNVYNDYIDFVGAQKSGAVVDGYEKNPIKGLSSERLFKQYYSMDPVKQATKDLSARDDSKWWNYVDLTKENGDTIPNILAFNPACVSEKKDIFTSKTKLYDYKPSVITCSFGIQATDNTANGGTGASRCFNWLSKNLYDEFLWIRRKGSENWGEPIESFKNETGYRAYYNRKTREYSDGTVVTAHRIIVSGLTKGEYEYIAGHRNQDNTPNLSACTDVRSFKVRANSDVASGFTFVQTTDQQGFNWDEYQVWRAASKNVFEEYGDEIEFMINTGDIAQNGNRMNEWIDYFQSKDELLQNFEENATIGNNDLSPKTLYKLGDGEDNCKLSLENYEFFFFSEINEDNPPVFEIDSVEYFIPSLYSFNYGNTHFLCVNSEIKANAEHNELIEDIYQAVYPFATSGNFYPEIKKWCEKDSQLFGGMEWYVAYCHEMPFTILITGYTGTNASKWYIDSKTRPGSNANTNIKQPAEGTSSYWLSEFCQTHGYRLMIGGHKHTQATSWPILENVHYNNGIRTVDSFLPIIVLNDSSELANFTVVSGQVSTTLVSVDFAGGTRKYPNKWVENDTVINAATGLAYLCEFRMKSELPEGTCPVVYAMSQATSYKHTSNKELPGAGIPWLRYYYPTAAGSTKALAGQKFPFFTIWTIDSEKIEGKVRKTYGVFDGDGNFDINIDGPYVKRGYSAVEKNNVVKIHSINGLSNSTPSESTDDILINK